MDQHNERIVFCFFPLCVCLRQQRRQNIVGDKTTNTEERQIGIPIGLL